MKRSRTIRVSVFVSMLGWLFPLAAAAQPEETQGTAATAKSAKEQPATGRKFTVAVLDFTSSDASNPSAGSEMAAALTAMLSGESGITLVERQSITETLREHELNLTGLVDDAQAIKVGKLVGARIMVTGRAFRLGKDLVLTAKIIGTETSLVEAVMAKDASSAELGALVVQLSEKLAAKIRESGPKLVAATEEDFDPLPGLKKRLAGRKLPVVAVIVREQHHAAPAPVVQRPIDPAAETEIKKILIDAGFTVQDVPQNEITGLARDWNAKDVDSWPRGLDKVDVLIAGEAFSEFAARIGNIVSCSARVEINVVGRKDGKIVVADRTTVRAADLSEQIAGKKALQSGGRAMAIRILERFAETLPVANAK